MNNQLTKRDLVEGNLYILSYPDKKVIYVGIEEREIKLSTGTYTGIMTVYRFFNIDDKKDVFLSESMIPINIKRIDE